MSRLPDFIIVGAMKAGTTTAYRWLDTHPGTALPAVKEPDFFCFDDAYRQGLGTYSGHFAASPERLLTGEASVKYTAPEYAEKVADRIAADLPAVKLVAVLRDPLERLRSEYRFSVQRGWEHDGFADALARPGNPYVGKSCYHRCLAPYFERFGSDRLLVLRTEELNGTGPAWPALLHHLGLAPVAAPTERHNETDALPQMRPIARLLDKRTSRKAIAVLPASVRRLGRRAITDNSADAAIERRAASEGEVAPAVLAALRDDTQRLMDRLGWASVPWPSVVAPPR